MTIEFFHLNVHFRLRGPVAIGGEKMSLDEQPVCFLWATLIELSVAFASRDFWANKIYLIDKQTGFFSSALNVSKWCFRTQDDWRGCASLMVFKENVKQSGGFPIVYHVVLGRLKSEFIRRAWDMRLNEILKTWLTLYKISKFWHRWIFHVSWNLKIFKTNSGLQLEWMAHLKLSTFLFLLAFFFFLFGFVMLRNWFLLFFLNLTLPGHS